MKISKIEKIILFFIAVFAVSLISAFLNSSANDISAFELGKLTGLFFTKFIKFLAIAGLIVFAYRKVKGIIAIKG